MSMLRLVERVMGEGELVRAGEMVRVSYELSCYQEFRVADGELDPMGLVLEGYLHAAPEVLEPLLGTAAVSTLRLDDGRQCHVFVLNTDGAITSADERGFHTSVTELASE